MPDPAAIDAIAARAQDLATKLAATVGQPALDAALLATRMHIVKELAFRLLSAAGLSLLGWTALKVAQSPWPENCEKRADERQTIEVAWKMAAFLLFVFAGVAVVSALIDPIGWIGLFHPEAYLAYRVIFGG